MNNGISVWEDLKNAYEGDSCFILGNGGSLANEDSRFLKSLPCFGTNRIYLKLVPDFYVCVNPYVAEQYKDDIEKMPTFEVCYGQGRDTWMYSVALYPRKDILTRP